MLDVTLLRKGLAYVFHIKELEVEPGQIIPGSVKKRVYRGRVQIEQIPFVEVENPEGLQQLIAEEMICKIELVTC